MRFFRNKYAVRHQTLFKSDADQCFKTPRILNQHIQKKWFKKIVGSVFPQTKP